ncbi:hypothetical protein E2C01_084648 [Portunus trituberculatus]|uniref:Uncharacterized protein n=1 Tax=Portunus trituberculatus TaxID=210409 RepID=A0A5B7J0J8_PORTR|nr:hypothetical protein [Portunus trituberculatus]
MSLANDSVMVVGVVVLVLLLVLSWHCCCILAVSPRHDLTIVHAIHSTQHAEAMLWTTGDHRGEPERKKKLTTLLIIARRTKCRSNGAWHGSTTRQPSLSHYLRSAKVVGTAAAPSPSEISPRNAPGPASLVTRLAEATSDVGGRVQL